MNPPENMKLVFATHNQNKLKEVQRLLPPNFEILSLDDIGCKEDIPETADSIDGNAIQKAEYVKKHYNYECFADDTGLEVDALSGAPGVYSARYAGEEKNEAANMTKLLKELENTNNRKARFKTVIALKMNDHEILFQGICPGEIIRSPRGKKGFGYDPVFQPEGNSRTFAEMEMSEKSQLSHRGKAMGQLIKYLSE